MKEVVLKYCLRNIEATIAEFAANLEAVQESIETEEKSSMGDKYETGRAMAQQEQDRLRKQLAEAKREYQMLLHPSMSQKHSSAQLGSLITTDKRMIYLGPALGVIKVDDKPIITTSMQSPLAQVFLEAKTGDQIEFRGQQERIKQVE